MIFRNVQDVTIRKYGTAFLEAFGMLPLTYFGAVGDNRTDNYANIQVAIDESIKKGLRYIFVPNGTYYYYGTLLNLDKIIFIGNEEYATIYNDDGVIPIYQIGTQIPYEKGHKTLDNEITEDGSIDLPISTKNGTEAILVIDNDILKIDGDIVTLNGSLYSPETTKVYLSYTDASNNVYIDNVSIKAFCIQIDYKVEGTGGTLDKRVDWRVR